MSQTRNIAIFDLDYTLTKRGTWGRFVWRVVRFRPWLWLPLLLAAGITQARYKRGKLPRIRVKQAMMRWSMIGMDKSKLINMAQDFADNEVRHGLRKNARKVMAKHQSNGDVLMIISAAVDIIVEPIAKQLGFDHFMATNMKWEQGKLAPDFASKNCYGAEKVSRLEALFAQKPELKQTDTLITFYSDSHSDVELMAYSNVAIAVNPSPRLRQIALKRGWIIEDWDK